MTKHSGVPGAPLDAGAYFGTRGATRSTDIVTLTTTEYACGAVVPPHAHVRPYFCYVTAGAFRETGARRAYDAARGALLYHPAGETHADAFDARGGRCFNIELADVARDATAPGPVAGRAVRYAAEMYREARAWDAASPLVVDGLVAALVARAYSDQDVGRRPVRADATLDRARERLLADVAHPPALAEIAAEAGMATTAFSRAFRRRFGCGAGAALRAERVERAKRALLATSRPLSGIAAELGFADQAHFTRVFRDATGWTPAAYRRDTR